MIKYRVVYKQEIKELERIINEYYLEEGWRLRGDLFVNSQSSNGVAYFGQVVVKEV